ncbi:MAG: ATP-dependent RNA helicase HrpA [Betaproteobacteria bacterium]|nr:ATP-dependent RNA helicase HrpA [Betaproteobacteria bacterium]
MRARRLLGLPKPEFDPALPVNGKRDEIRAAIEAHQVVIVCGETGSGKTTQIPKILLEMQRGVAGWIGHTQPRRIAARSVAARIAQELKVELGGAVGYKVRFNDKVRPESYVKLMTDGILLAETQGDPLLSHYDTLIIDEAHERSLNIDFLLGYLLRLLPRRPDLKLIITSATIDAEKFAKHFALGGREAPVIEVSGRLYPVEVRYRPVEGDAEDTTRDEEEAALADAVDDLMRAGPGDILVFLPGEREIRETTAILSRHLQARSRVPVELLPLYSRLTATEQDRVFRPSGNARRIVLATNVAETSLTVPGIRYVIDTGYARVKRYSYRNKVEQLRVEKISRASAAQRAGRCGRVANGICVRLYDEDDYKQRAEFTDPEVLRSSLASVILRAKSLHLGDPAEFPFVDPPPPRAIADGYALLTELGAVDEANELTDTGRELARLPLDPRIARMLIGAQRERCLEQVLVIAAALSVSDPRDRPMDKQNAADLAHAKFDDPRSDFIAFLKLWKFFGAALDEKLSNNRLAALCRQNFLSIARMREWREVHRQLQAQVEELEWKPSAADPDKPEGYRAIHRALLTGLLGNIGMKGDEDSAYTGARGIKFWVHPGSGTKKPGRWIMAAELTETTRLYARCAAAIEPQWLEELGAHLMKKSRDNPHWEKTRAQVVAVERGTLYGLPVYQNRRVHYGPMDPEGSREVFLRAALVEGEFDTRAPFFAHNAKLLAEIERLEHKSRRPDILVDDELIYAFYDSRVPEGIHNGADFEKWRKEAEQKEPKLLHLRREDLMRHEAAGITTENFPGAIRLGPNEFRLEYHFEPGSARDGVTMTVPVALLNQISAARCDWMVPGLLKEKVQALAKSMPQRLRHKLGPLAEFAEGFAATMKPAALPTDTSLASALARYIRTEIGVEVPQDAFRPDSAPPHLHMNYKVVDEHGRQLGLGRNLAELRSQLRGETEAILQDEAPVTEGEKYTGWTFGDLDEVMELKRGGHTLVGYPGLVDAGDAVTLQVFDSPEKAREAHRAGVRRLLAIVFKERLKDLDKSLSRDPALGPIKEQVIALALDRTFLAQSLPMAQKDFAARVEEGRNRFGLIAQEVVRTLNTVLAEHRELQKKIASAAKGFPLPAEDVKQQAARLIAPQFLVHTPWERLQHLPRYLKAAGLRLDKLRADPARDARLAAELAPLAVGWQREAAARMKSGGMTPELEQFRWLLEELRVALFAQELRTPVPVSSKRLAKLWQSLRSH